MVYLVLTAGKLHWYLVKAGFPLPIRSTRSTRSPKFPDQARPSSTKGVYTTSSRPLVDHTRFPHDYSRLLHDVNPTTFHQSCRPTQTSTRSLDRAWSSWSDRQWEPSLTDRAFYVRLSEDTMELPLFWEVQAANDISTLMSLWSSVQHEHEEESNGGHYSRFWKGQTRV